MMNAFDFIFGEANANIQRQKLKLCKLILHQLVLTHLYSCTLIWIGLHYASGATEDAGQQSWIARYVSSGDINKTNGYQLYLLVFNHALRTLGRIACPDEEPLMQSKLEVLFYLMFTVLSVFISMSMILNCSRLFTHVVS